jgi:organic hydroperoxide reductase OsmC/OhrA
VGANPEQLFAAGYAGCFLGAIQAVAGKDGKDATVKVKTHLGASEGISGFALSVEIEVAGVKDEEIIRKAHEVSNGLFRCEVVVELIPRLQLCPYSRALQHGAKTVARLV